MSNLIHNFTTWFELQGPVSIGFYCLCILALSLLYWGYKVAIQAERDAAAADDREPGYPVPQKSMWTPPDTDGVDERPVGRRSPWEL